MKSKAADVLHLLDSETARINPPPTIPPRPPVPPSNRQLRRMHSCPPTSTQHHSTSHETFPSSRYSTSTQETFLTPSSVIERQRRQHELLRSREDTSTEAEFHLPYRPNDYRRNSSNHMPIARYPPTHLTPSSLSDSFDTSTASITANNGYNDSAEEQQLAAAIADSIKDQKQREAEEYEVELAMRLSQFEK